MAQAADIAASGPHFVTRKGIVDIVWRPAIRRLRSLRELIGVFVKDRTRYRQRLSSSETARNGDPLWTRLCNRQDEFEENPRGHGVRCKWQWSSSLHACDVVPAWGQRLLECALESWPIQFQQTIEVVEKPQLSFLFAHRGDDRLPQLELVLQSVFAQQDVKIECVVIDLSDRPCEERLPSGITYRHLNVRHLKAGWYKAWAYNLAAREAKGDILVFHDGDVCVPRAYARELLAVFGDGGYGTASIQRFLFYLNSEATAQVLAERGIVPGIRPVRVLQNWKGGTIAARRDAFFRLGGFDEGFVNWGGEDDEFYDRCEAMGHCRFGYLPFVHLHHAPQRDRGDLKNPNVERVLPDRLAIPARLRIAELTARGFGRLAGPIPEVSYKDQLSSPGSSQSQPSSDK